MSKPQVTITLGRSGQVVKRPVAVENYRSDNGGALSGNKRSIRDRLGNQSLNKRQRKDGNMGSGDDNIDGIPVRQDDLRFKLRRKNMSRRTLSNGGEIDIDLREKLSRTTQPPSRYDTRERVPEPGRLRRIPPTRSADDLLHMDSLRKSYSSAWDLDKLRRRSPDRFVSTSRGVSPPRDMEQRRQVRHVEASRPVVPSRPVDSSRPVGPSRPVDSSRPLDISRSTAYTSKDFYSGSRPTPYLTKSAVPESAKPVARHPPPSTSGVMPKTYSGEEPLTVAGLLTSLGLGKYAILFQAEEVDMTALRQMGDQDLKELGIPMGPRKKILLAVLPRMKRKP